MLTKYNAVFIFGMNIKNEGSVLRIDWYKCVKKVSSICFQILKCEVKLDY